MADSVTSTSTQGLKDRNYSFQTQTVLTEEFSGLARHSSNFLFLLKTCIKQNLDLHICIQVSVLQFYLQLNELAFLN